jgi:hypothetical protein
MEVREFALGAVPGLLQAEGYARALFSISPDATPDKTAERVTARIQRQRKFFSRSLAPSLLCLIDGLALRRDAGPGIMAAQVRHLKDAAAWPSVTIQLTPAMLLERRFNKIRSEAYGASESSRRLERIAHELDMAQEYP